MGMKPWAYPLRMRTRFIAEVFSKHGWDVVYVNPLWNSSCEYSPRLIENTNIEREGEVTVVTLPASEMYFLSKKETQVNYENNSANLKKALSRLDFNPDVVWLSTPLDLLLLPDWHGFTIVDYFDDISGYFPILEPRMPEYFKKADIILPITETLIDKIPESERKKAYLSPSATPSTEIKSNDVRGDGVVFAGVMNSRFDVSWIEHAAKSNPNVSFTLIGIDFTEHDYSDVGNVEVKPPMEHSVLIEEMSNYKIGVIPYITDSEAHYCDPQKIYDYINAGLHVISSDVLAVHRYPLCKVVTDKESFSSMIASLIPTLLSSSDFAQMHDFLNENTWEVRVNSIEKLIKENT